MIVAVGLKRASLDLAQPFLSNKEWAVLQLAQIMREGHLSREQALEVAKAVAPTLYKMLFTIGGLDMESFTQKQREKRAMSPNQLANLKTFKKGERAAIQAVCQKERPKSALP